MKEQKKKTPAQEAPTTQEFDLGGGYTATVYSPKETAILNLITAVCEECPARTRCSEERCPIFLIEKIVTDGK